MHMSVQAEVNEKRTAALALSADVATMREAAAQLEIALVDARLQVVPQAIGPLAVCLASGRAVL